MRPLLLPLLLSIILSACQPAPVPQHDGFEKAYTEAGRNIRLTLPGDQHRYRQLQATVAVDDTVIRSRVPMSFPVVDHRLADITGNGRLELVLMVEKSTAYDPVVRKRVFLYHLQQNRLKPLWLSSRLHQPLEALAIIPVPSGKALVRTVEHEANGNFRVSEYTWRQFGLEWLRDRGTDLSLNAAQKLLHHVP
ncbi:MAG: hypothetical protein AAGB22_07830 [Bacteroidota bacterium]